MRGRRYHLTRSDWLKLCTSMCMTLLEARLRVGLRRQADTI